MKLITEMYDDYQILTEEDGKDMKIQGVFMQVGSRIKTEEFILLVFWKRKSIDITKN